MANPDAAAREALTIVAVDGGRGKGNDDGRKDRQRSGDDDGKKDRDRNNHDDNKNKRDNDKRRNKNDDDNKKPPDTPASTNYDPSKDKPPDSDDDNSKGGGGSGPGPEPGPGPSSYLDSTFQITPNLKLKIRSSSDDPPMSVTYHGDPPSSGGSDGGPGFGGGGPPWDPRGGPSWDSWGGPPTDSSWYEGDNGYGYGGGWYPGGGGGPAIPVGGMPGNPQTASLPVEQSQHGGGRRPPFDPVMLGTARTPSGFDTVHVAMAGVFPRTPVAIPRYKPFREVPSLVSSSSSSMESEILTPLTPLELKTAFMPPGMEIDPFTYSSAKPAKSHFSAQDLHNDELNDLQDILQGRERKGEGIDLRPRRLSELLEVPGLGETLGPAGGDRYNPTMFGDLAQDRRGGVPLSPIRVKGGMSPIDLNPVYIEEKGERVTNLSPLRPGIPAENGERVKRREKVRNGLVSPRAVNLPTPVAEESQREKEGARRKERQKQEIGVPDDYEKARVRTRKEREREKIPVSPERAKKMRKQKVKVVDRDTGRVKSEEILVTDSEAGAEKILSPGRRTAKVRIRGTLGESEEEALYERERSRKKRERLRQAIRNDESEEEYVTVDKDGRRVKRKEKRRVPISEDEEERVRLRRKERNEVGDSEDEVVRAERRRAKVRRERLRNGRVGVGFDEEEEEPLYERHTDRNGRPKLRKMQHDDPYQEFYRQRNRNRERVRGGRGIEEYEEEYEMGGQARVRRRVPQQPIYQDDGIPLQNIPNYQLQQGQQVPVNPILAQRRQLNQATIEDELARENPSLSRTEREDMARLRLRNYESGRDERLDRTILQEEGDDANISVKERERLAKLRLQHMDADEDSFSKTGHRLGQGEDTQLQTKQQHHQIEEEEQRVRAPGQRRRIQNETESVELDDTSVESAEKAGEITLGHAERVNTEMNVTVRPESPRHEVLVRPDRPQGPNQQNRRHFALRENRRLDQSDDEAVERQAETEHASETVPLNVQPKQETEIFELPATPVGQRRTPRVENADDIRQEMRSGELTDHERLDELVRQDVDTVPVNLVTEHGRRSGVEENDGRERRRVGVDIAARPTIVQGSSGGGQRHERTINISSSPIQSQRGTDNLHSDHDPYPFENIINNRINFVKGLNPGGKAFLRERAKRDWKEGKERLVRDNPHMSEEELLARLVDDSVEEYQRRQRVNINTETDSRIIERTHALATEHERSPLPSVRRTQHNQEIMEEWPSEVERRRPTPLALEESGPSRGPVDELDRAPTSAQLSGPVRQWEFWRNIIEESVDSCDGLSARDNVRVKMEASAKWHKKMKKMTDHALETDGKKLLEDMVDVLIREAGGVRRNTDRSEAGPREPEPERNTTHPTRQRQLMEGEEPVGTRQHQRREKAQENPSVQHRLDTQSEARRERRRQNQGQRQRQERAHENGEPNRVVMDVSHLNEEQIKEYEETGKLPSTDAQREDREDTTNVRPTLAHQARDDHVQEAGGRSNMQMASTRPGPVPAEDADIGAPDGRATVHTSRRQGALALAASAEPPAEERENTTRVRLTADPEVDYSLYEDEPDLSRPTHANVRPIVQSEKEYNNSRPIPEEIAVGEKSGGYDSGYGTDEDREIEVHERSAPPKISIDPKDRHDDGRDLFAHTGRVRLDEYPDHTGRPRVPREFREEHGRWPMEGEDPIDGFHRQMWEEEFANTQRGARDEVGSSDHIRPVRHESTEEPRRQSEEPRRPIGGDNATSWDWPEDLPNPEQNEVVQVHQTSVPEYKIGKENRPEQAWSEVAPARKPEVKRPGLEAPLVPSKETSRADADEPMDTRRAVKKDVEESRISPVKMISKDDDERVPKRAEVTARPREDEKIREVSPHSSREKMINRALQDAQMTRDNLRHARRVKREDDDESEDPGMSMAATRPGLDLDEDREPKLAERPVDARQGDHKTDKADLFEHTGDVIPATGNALPGQKEKRPVPHSRASIQKSHRDTLSDFQKLYSSKAQGRDASFEKFQQDLLERHQQQSPLQVHTTFVPDVEQRDVGRSTGVDSTLEEEETRDETRPLKPPNREGTKPNRVPVRSDVDVRGDRVRSRDEEEEDELKSDMRTMGHGRRKGVKFESKQNKGERSKEVSEDYYQSDAEEDGAQNHGRRRMRSNRGGGDSPSISPLSPRSRPIVNARARRRAGRFRERENGAVVSDSDVSDEDRESTPRAKGRRDAGGTTQDQDRGALGHRSRGGRRTADQGQENSEDEVRAGRSRRQDRRSKAGVDVEENEEDDDRDIRKAGGRNAQFGRRARRGDRKFGGGEHDEEEDILLAEDDRAQNPRGRPNQARPEDTSQDDITPRGGPRSNGRDERSRWDHSIKGGRRDGRIGQDGDTDSDDDDLNDAPRRPRDVSAPKDAVDEPRRDIRHNNRTTQIGSDSDSQDTETDDPDQQHRRRDQPRQNAEQSRQARAEDESDQAKAEASRKKEDEKMARRQEESIRKQEKKLNSSSHGGLGDDDDSYMREYNTSSISWRPKIHLRAGWNILKNAPFWSSFSAIEFILYVEITRQLFSMLSISSGSLSAASSTPSSRLSKRANSPDELGFDLQLTQTWFFNMFQSNGVESTSFFVFISLWNIICIPLLGCLIYATLEKASNPHEKESSRSWLLRKLRSAVEVSERVILMDRKFHGFRSFIKRFSLWTIVRLSVFICQVIGTALVFRQTMSLAYLSAAGSSSTTSTFSDAADVSATIKSLSEFAGGLTNAQVFGITNFVFLVLLLNLAISWYSLLHSKKTAAKGARSILKWISIALITTPFVVCLLYFQEIANYLIQSQNSTGMVGDSGTIVLVGANFMFMGLLPGMGYVVYELGKVWDRKFPNGFFNRRGTRSSSGGGSSWLICTDCGPV
ncbi:hypothetical protein I302_100370 [Kwoniella bestiolae CBS 10118]|uniref:Uncharacterized protein n=1 Tax=Kwoniella bestiolae CBS 10118 TaxID=1296100 RepID=A0A1B9G4U9_9TREE|nr:hypothetical protein I302_03744 [Kwoniella bestiolae CBS 10118]OCF26067.1 hypothetical protein I302_03744 [Kwoniella bestiolae CBS 10118]